MAGDLETIKTVATVAAPLTAAIVETWIKPKLAQLHKYLNTDKALFENALVSKFDEYLIRAYERNSYISVIVFPNQQKRLEDIYIPLTVQAANRKVKISIDGYREEFIHTYKKILIRDTAGVGKSTLLKYLFVSCVQNNKGVPVFIELRKLKSDQSVLTYIYNELNPIDCEFDKEFILKLIKEGGFIFFFDGYDEIPFNERDNVTTSLQDFISKAGNNLFVLTSRPELSLASFPDFQEFNIRPLESAEAFELLKKYDEAGELSAEIISKLESKTFQNIEEFLQNPLLVSLLYKSYEYKHTIPFKQHIFYRQVYDALFESHDLTKSGSFTREKHTGLDIEEFHRVLRAIGFITVKLGQIEFDKDSLLSLIKRGKDHSCNLNFKESDFLKDLLSAVPLFNRDGNYFKWTHKAIQEYFAAQFIWLDTKGNQGKILKQIVRKDNAREYYNVLDLYYDIDFKSFQQTIIYDYLCDFIKYYDSSYLLINRGQISEKDIHDRKSLVFGKTILLLKYELQTRVLSSKDTISELVSVAPDLNNALQDLKRSQLHHTANFIGFYHGEPVKTILDKRTEEIFINKDVWELYKKLWKELRSPRRLDERYKLSFLHYVLERGGKNVLIIDDNPDSIINQKECFADMNLVLAASSAVSEKYLDIDKCRGLKLKIEDDIAREASAESPFNDI
jgi:hypothetical protein